MTSNLGYLWAKSHDPIVRRGPPDRSLADREGTRKAAHLDGGQHGEGAGGDVLDGFGPGHQAEDRVLYGCGAGIGDHWGRALRLGAGADDGWGEPQAPSIRMNEIAAGNIHRCLFLPILCRVFPSQVVFLSVICSETLRRSFVGIILLIVVFAGHVEGPLPGAGGLTALIVVQGALAGCPVVRQA